MILISHLSHHILNPRSSQPDTPPVAKVIFIHGFSDHINRYPDLFPYLSSRGIAVHGFDQRGWGRSVSKPAERGASGPTPRVVADMAAFIRPHLPASPSDPPVFVMGHSMGGGQVLKLMCDTDGEYADLVRRVRGWLCEAPFVGLAAEERPSWLTVFAGRLVGRILPKMHMVRVIPPEHLSRLPEVVESIRGDELMHNTGTLEGLAGLLDRSAELSSGRARPDGKKVKALWIGHGTMDRGTDYGETKKWFDNCAGEVGDREFRTYEGAYHQLHADIGREEFAKDVAEWILKRAGGSAEGSGEGNDEAKPAEVKSKPVESKL